MMTRRDLIATSAAAAATPALGAPAAPKAQLDALMTAFADEELRRSPETVTGLGLDLDMGDYAAAKSALDDRSLAAREQDKRRQPRG